MGYSTDFDGEFVLNKPLEPQHKAYLDKFSEIRHMKRNPAICAKMPDPIRESAGLDLGPMESSYFVGATGDFGQGQDESIIDYNQHPEGVPSLWCQWVPNDEGTEVQHDGGEKFYEYIEWIKYLIAHFYGPWGYKLNGKVIWQGEDMSDRGKIEISNNVIKVTELE